MFGLLLSFSLASIASASSTEAKVTSGVNFRTGPSTNSSIIRLLPKGDTVQVMTKVNSYWLKVKAKDGRTGYVSTKYVQLSGNSTPPSSGSPGSSPSSKADAIIATAKSLIGRAEYDFGTRDRNRLIFDCSSFTEYVFEKNGIELKWDTRFQKNARTAVSKSNLQKGDLVFFSVGKSTEIGHVGIYISDGNFINILDKKESDVLVANLNSGYWADHYVTARRVIQ